MASYPKILILGAGKSGIGAADLLSAKGEPFLISTSQSPDEMTANVCQRNSYPLQIGPQTEQLITNIKAIVVSPGISPLHPVIFAARKNRIPVISEIDLALSDFEQPWVAITGTNGKSTCTEWLAAILRSHGYKGVALGNIGRPPSEYFAECLKKGQNLFQDICVVELSSFQLDYSHAIRPQVAIITSFAPDHLDRYSSLKTYFQSKWSITKRLRPDGVLITTAHVLKYAKKFGCHIAKENLILICESVDEADEFAPYTAKKPILLTANESKIEIDGQLIKLPFDLNHLNINAVICLLAAGAISGKSITEFNHTHLKNDLKPLPHRCEVIAQWSGFPVINDSKSTNLASTQAAIKGLSSPCYLLLGGIKKPESFKPINAYRDQIRKIFLYGHSANDIKSDITDIPCETLDNLDSCIQNIRVECDQNPAIVLFSPACASYDQFDNFNHRGAHFKKLVQQSEGDSHLKR